MQYLNSRHLLRPNRCIANIGGLVTISTQLYFNYPSGDIQIVNLDPNCQTASNGKLTAQFSRYTF